MATLAIFDWPGAVKDACWGASPNPALWDKMSQRDWLRHRYCRAGSLFYIVYIYGVTGSLGSSKVVSGYSAGTLPLSERVHISSRLTVIF